jgi:3-hydroxyacyl-CoA dehydrogenase
MIDAYRREIGIAPRAIGADEIVDRCILALVNEGARVLQEGIAMRASDIDVVYLNGYGFPAAKGGPMFYAQEYVGLEAAIRRVNEFARLEHADRAFWVPAQRLVEAAAAGGFAKVELAR